MDSEYILRIILRARDELAAGLAAARAELKAFSKDTKGLQDDLNKLNTKFDNLDKRAKKVRESLIGARAAVQEFTKGSSDDFDKLDKATRKATDSLAAQDKAVRAALKTHGDAAQSAHRLGDAQARITKEYQNNEIGAKRFTTELKAIGVEYDQLAKKFDVGTKERRNLESLANTAREAANGVANAEKEAAKSREDTRKHVADAQRKADQESARSAKQLADARAREAERSANEEIRANKRAVREAETASRDKLALAARSGRAERGYKQTVGGGTDQEQIANLRKYAQEFSTLSRAHGIASTEGAKFARMEADARTRLDALSPSARRVSNDLRRLSSDTRAAGQETRGLMGWLDRQAQTMARNSESVARFDNKLRGLIVLAVVAFAQQLTTVLLALGGELISVGSSAIMAGGALGGALAAGIAQALPVIGLLAGAFNRVKGVMTAMQTADQMRQQQNLRSMKSDQAAGSQADQLANAQDSLRSAIEGVADAHRSEHDAQLRVIQARRDAVRQIQDLIMAEKQADLAARGATLSQEDAQRALKAAVAGGDVAAAAQARLQIANTRVDATQQTTTLSRARTDATRAVAGGVSKQPGVVSANQQLAQSQRAITNAERSVSSAKRSIDQARLSAAKANSDVFAAAANLKYQLSQLSPAERRLYTTLTNIRKQWRTTWEGVTDPMIRAVTRGANWVYDTMRQPRIINAAKNLSHGIGEQFDVLRKSFTDTRSMQQFMGFIHEAGRNLPLVGKGAASIGHIFMNIAEGAAPAFHRLLGFIDGILKHFENLTGNRKKTEDFFNLAERHLEGWVKLAGAIGRMFIALTGAGQKQGLDSINELTKYFNHLADRIDHNRGAIQHFLRDAHTVIKDLLGVLGTLGKEMLKSFNPGNTSRLATFLKKTVIPAFGLAIRTVGFFTAVLTTLLSLPIVGSFAKWAIAIALVGKATSGVTSLVEGGLLGVFGRVNKEGVRVGGLVGSFQKIRQGAINAGVGVSKFGRSFAPAAASLEIASASGGRFAGVASKLAPLVTGLGQVFVRFGAALGVAADFLLGPWGLAIAAVIAGIYLLDKKFHFIGPTLKWLKGAFSDVFDWLKTHWPLVLFILIGPFAILPTLVAKHWKAIKHGFTDGVNAVKGVISGLGHWISNAMHNIVSAISSILPSGFKHAGHGAADGLLAGIKTVGHFFANIGKWFFDHLIKPIYDFFEIKSPSGLFRRIGKNLVDGLINGFKTLPGMLIDAVEGMADKLLGVGKKIGEWIRKGLEKVPGGKLILGAAGKVKGLLDKVNPFASGGPVPGTGSGDTVPAMLTPGEHVLTKDEVAAAGGHSIIFAIRRLLGGGRQGGPTGFAAGGRVSGGAGLTVTFRSGDMSSFADEFRMMWKTLTVLTRNGTDLVQRETRQMRLDVTDSLTKMFLDGREQIVNLEMSAKVHFTRLVNVADDTFKSLGDATYKGLFYIAHEANKALTGFGGKAISFGLNAPGKAEGGYLGQPGERGRDRVLAWLGRGEAVLNWAHQRLVDPALRATYGFGLGELFGHRKALHAGTYDDSPGFAEGGVVGGKNSHAARLINAANMVDSKHLKYVWGGGHQQPAQVGDGMDCSGSVSYVVQKAGYKVPTTTSGDIPSWGFPSGPGAATIFYNPTHTFMRIGGKYWGTTGFGHPGWTGAGWFTQNPSPGYLRQFKTVHLPDLHGLSNFVAGDVSDIKPPKITGQRGPLRSMVQRMFNKITHAANEKVSAAASALDPGGGQWGDLQVGPGAMGIVKAFKSIARSMGIPKVGLLAGVEAGIVESGLRNIGGGDRDSAGVLQQRPSAGWGTYEQVTNVGHAIGRFFESLKKLLPWSGTAGALAQAVQRSAFPGRYDQRRGQAMDLLHRIGAPGFKAGGIVPGHPGKAVKALVHAGEWVVNPVQQARLAQLAGTNVGALRSMLGFYDHDPRLGHAAGTGDVSDISNKPSKPLYVPELTSIDPLELENIGTVAAVVNSIIRAINKTGKNAKSRAERLRKLFTELTSQDEGTSSLNTLATAVDGTNTALTRLSTRLKFMRGAFHSATSVLLRESPEQQATRALNDTVASYNNLLGERGVILKAMSAASKQMAHAKTEAEKNNAEAALVAGRKALTDVDDKLNEALQARQQAQIDQQQAVVDAINKRAEKVQNFGQLLVRAATATGNDSLLDKANAAMRDSMTSQANELEARVKKARAAGATDLADQLEQQVNDLRMQVFESIQQQVQTSIDRINNDAQKAQAGVDRQNRVAAVVGQIGDFVNGQTGANPVRAAQLAESANRQAGTNITAQRDALNRVLSQQLSLPPAMRNQKVIEDLTGQIDDLNVSLVENTAQQKALEAATRQATLDVVTSRQAFQGGVQGNLGTILQTVAAITGNPTTAEQLDLAQGSRGTLQGTRDQLRGQLAGEYGINLLGRSGVDFVDAVKKIDFDKIESTMSAADKTTFENLVNAVIDNESALDSNTQTIQQLNGQISEPQSFTTTAWQWFRTAIFNGMGQVFPNYQIPQFATGGVALKAGLYHMEPGEAAVPLDKRHLMGGNKTIEQNIEVSYHEVNEAPSALETANRVAWELKTANTLS